MHYVVLAYPEISQSDYAWVQAIRKNHDRQFAAVEPHFTIVFPTTKLSGSEMLAHVESLKLDTKQFTFTLTKAIVEENIYPRYFQVHLVATEPIPEIVRLHDLLYAGALAGELRKDIPYVPHITIASNEDKAVMESLAEEINTKGLSITGKISDIVVSSFDGTKVADIRRFQLRQF